MDEEPLLDVRTDTAARNIFLTSEEKKLFITHGLDFSGISKITKIINQLVWSFCQARLIVFGRLSWEHVVARSGCVLGLFLCSPMMDVNCRNPTEALIARATSVPSQNWAENPIKQRLNKSFATDIASIVLTTLQYSSFMDRGTITFLSRAKRKNNIKLRVNLYMLLFPHMCYDT